MMAATAVSHGLRSLSRGETGKAWLILKCCVAVVCAPLGVFMELHAVEPPESLRQDQNRSGKMASGA
jgi:hypothetical protein